MIPVPPGAGGPPPERPRVTITVPAAAADLVTAWLYLHTDGGLQVHDGDTAPPAAAADAPVRLVLWPAPDAVPDVVFGLGALFAALRERRALAGPTHVEIDEDPGLWARPRQVVRVGRFVVARPWLDYPAAEGEIALSLDPGPDGDDGRHPATALALLQLERLAAAGHEVERALDVRCGSGVTAMAAARLWPAATVDAVAADGPSYALAAANVAGAGLAARIALHRASSEAIEGPYGLAVARASAREQQAIAPLYERLLGAGARAVATGFPLGSVDTVERIFVGHGLYRVERDALEEWAALTFVK